jgi:hypothetical protein
MSSVDSTLIIWPLIADKMSVLTVIIEEYVKDGKYEIELRNPKEADFTYLAFVSFSKPEEGLAACTGIDHSF